MEYTRKSALQIAKNYGLEAEIKEAMKHCCNPREALEEWDCLQVSDYE